MALSHFKIGKEILVHSLTVQFATFLVFAGAVCAFAGECLGPDSVAQIRDRRMRWGERAEVDKPVLFSRIVRPNRIVRIEHDEDAFQKCRVTPAGSVSDVLRRDIGYGGCKSFIVDFGEHLVGYPVFRIGEGHQPADSPVKLRLFLAELPAEIERSAQPLKKGLSPSWIPEETVFFDEVPAVRELPRRQAFRYMQVAIESTCSFAFEDISVRAVTSADERNLQAWSSSDTLLVRIDAVAVRTLRDCMQTMFEDGPKRDRRLWIGDLRIQALANYATYRNFELVRRCLYLFACTADGEELVSSDVYERPQPRRGSCRILDYTALFPAIVLEYLEASDDRETAEDLWPLCCRQFDFVMKTVGEDGLFRDDGKWWCFIDWNDKLDRQAAEQGVIVYGVERLRRLALRLGHENEVADLVSKAARMKSAARQRLWDESKGVFVSGPNRQVSQIAQAWLVLAGIAEEETARRCLRATLADSAAERPKTPYACHYLAEALQVAGLPAEAENLLKSYWGGMVSAGADTFWEAYDPTDDEVSPYGDVRFNSACHAWSCGPTYLLRSAGRLSVKGEMR